jgi:hypothetical protein
MDYLFLGRSGKIRKQNSKKKVAPELSEATLEKEP